MVLVFEQYLTCQYRRRAPHFNGTNLFRCINSKYFCSLDIPKSQPKPANLYKQDAAPHLIAVYLILSILVLYHISLNKVTNLFLLLIIVINVHRYINISINFQIHQINTVSAPERGKCIPCFWMEV